MLRGPESDTAESVVLAVLGMRLLFDLHIRVSKGKGIANEL